MKTFTTVLIFLLTLCLIDLNGQVEYPYDFSTFQEAYVDLEDPIILTDQYWDDFDAQTYEFPLGFEFNFFDQPMPSIFIGEFLAEVLYTQQDGMGNNNLMLPYNGDLMARVDNMGNVLSSISYKVEGEAGNRIMKGQFKDVGFYNDDEGGSYVNFQFWLYELDGAIEFRYGPSNLTYPIEYLLDDEAGPFVGLLNGYNYDQEEFGDLYMLSGDPANPDYIYLDGLEDEEFPPTLSGQPVDGTVYRFGPEIINNLNRTPEILNIKVFPTITARSLNIEGIAFEEITYSIWDLSGKTLWKPSRLQGSSIDVSGLNPGMYLIRFAENGQMFHSVKFIKSH
jgi:hypothetical protein